MLKKEISDVLKQTVIFTVFSLALPAFLILTTIISNLSYFSVFFPMFQFGLLFGAFFMGASLFSVERGQRGMEYLLSLPYSRYQVVGIKILPRLAAVLLFYAVFVILYTGGGEDLAAFSFFPFTFLYFSLYLISLSLSASSENFLVLFLSSLFSLFIYLNLLPFVFWLAARAQTDIPFYDLLDLRDFITAGWNPDIKAFLGLLSAFILLLPVLISFGMSVKKLDIRPAKVYNRHFFRLFAPIFLGALILSFPLAYRSIDMGYSQYYLTEDYKLIESDYYRGTRIYDENSVHKLKEKVLYWWPFFEEKGYVYSEILNEIVRFNPSDFTVEVLYKSPQRRRIRGPIWKYEQTFAFLEDNWKYREKKLIFLDEPSRNFTKIPLDVEPLNNYHIHDIFGADRIDGELFWLIVTWQSKEERHLFRLWEDGRIESIGKSQKWPYYINGMLLTYSENELIIHKEIGGKYIPIQRIPNPEGYNFGLGYYYRVKLDKTPIKELYGSRRASPKDPETSISYARLDLKNFKIDGIGKTKGRMDYHSPDDLFFIESAPLEAEIRIYKYADGKINLFKAFKDFDARESKNRYYTFKSGVVLRRGKKVKVYAYPDLKEIKFKKL